MKLHFLGANRQVTGSRYCLETNRSRVLIDCGMFQEREFQPRNWHPSPIEPNSVQAAVITHAHIDHCGLLPRFVREGFRGRVISTHATSELLSIMLEDALKIQLEDIKYKEKRHRQEQRATRYAAQPLFEEADVQTLLQLRESFPFAQPVQVTDDIQVTFHEAGHILGSAMLEFVVTEEGKTRRIFFSGDIGQWNKPLLRDPSVFPQTVPDYVVMESTYGDRLHPEAGAIVDQLEEAINAAIKRGGNVVIPTFAVERAQELMYFISQLVHRKRIPQTSIFLDSPMAVDVTDIFRRHRDEFDDETWLRVNAGEPPLHFPGLVLASSTQDSMRINDHDGPAIIMSTSGMCNAGRIKHHLRRNLPRREAVILFVGYQAEGTLGREILSGRKEVRIHGRTWPVKAEIRQIYGFSGHADQKWLLHWAGQFPQPPRLAFLTHGEHSAAQTLSQELAQRHQWKSLIPDYESTYDLE